MGADTRVHDVSLVCARLVLKIFRSVLFCSGKTVSSSHDPVVVYIAYPGGVGTHGKSEACLGNVAPHDNSIKRPDDYILRLF